MANAVGGWESRDTVWRIPHRSQNRDGGARICRWVGGAAGRCGADGAASGASGAV